jgi:hypothetical protein
MKTIKLLILSILTTVYSPLTGQDLDNGQIPFYALPFYSYKPLQIHIGRYSEELTTKDTTALLALAKHIKSHIDSVTIETLYILSMRLYELKRKDESFYWFHTAKTRARIFVEMLDPQKIGSIGSEAFELKHLFSSFNQLVGVYINGYGFNDVEKGASTMEIVKNEVKNILPFKSIYKTIHFLPDTAIQDLKAKKEKEMEESITYFRTNKDDIKKQRIEAGIQDKY